MTKLITSTTFSVINSFPYTLLSYSWSRGVVEPIPAAIRHKAGYLTNVCLTVFTVMFNIVSFANYNSNFSDFYLFGECPLFISFTAKDKNVSAHFMKTEVYKDYYAHAQICKSPKMSMNLFLCYTRL